LQRFWSPNRPGWGRLLDAAALLVIAFVAWKIFLAPRALGVARAHPAPHVIYQRLDGGTFALADQRGRLVFLDFFASWCEPCRLEIPMVERYARAHPEVLVVPVDVGEPAAVAGRFATRFHLRGVVLDPKALSQGFFAIQGFPTIVVIDPQGRIRATWTGFNPAIALAMANAERTLK
jgi:cytochrome c biogenesis protein CcmG/thiol:disulfide interchange protein DsbE